MPYIQIWVEPCDGDCSAGERADNLQEVIELAAELLRAGDADAALNLLQSPRNRSQEMADRYQAISQGKSTDFCLYRFQQSSPAQAWPVRLLTL